MNGLAPDIFKSFYQTNSDLHNYGSKHNSDIVVDLRHGTQSSFSMKHLGSSVRNGISVSIRAAGHVLEFKKKLKDYFLR